LLRHPIRKLQLYQEYYYHKNLASASIDSESLPTESVSSPKATTTAAAVTVVSEDEQGSETASVVPKIVSFQDIKVKNPQDFVGRRVAKYFPDEVDGTEKLYFGTVDYISLQDGGKVWWRIKYDDDDEEDFWADDLRKGINLYFDHQQNDKQGTNN